MGKIDVSWRKRDKWQRFADEDKVQKPTVSTIDLPYDDSDEQTSDIPAATEPATAEQDVAADAEIAQHEDHQAKERFNQRIQPDKATQDDLKRVNADNDTADLSNVRNYQKLRRQNPQYERQESPADQQRFERLRDAAIPQDPKTIRQGHRQAQERYKKVAQQVMDFTKQNFEQHAQAAVGPDRKLGDYPKDGPYATVAYKNPVMDENVEITHVTKTTRNGKERIAFRFRDSDNVEHQFSFPAEVVDMSGHLADRYRDARFELNAWNETLKYQDPKTRDAMTEREKTTLADYWCERRLHGGEEARLAWGMPPTSLSMLVTKMDADDASEFIEQSRRMTFVDPEYGDRYFDSGK